MSKASDIKQTGIEIKLDKTRHLIFDLNAFCELEEKYGNIDKAMQSMSSGSMKSIRFMLYIALKNEDPSLTEQVVGSLITMNNISVVAEALTRAMGVSLPEEEEKNM